MLSLGLRGSLIGYKAFQPNLLTRSSPQFFVFKAASYSSVNTLPRLTRGRGRLRNLFILGISLGVGINAGYQYRSSNVKAEDERRRTIEYKQTDAFQYLNRHPTIEKLRADPEFNESWYFTDLPANHKQHMLTSGLLTGEGKISIEPIKFQSKDGKKLYIFYHVGDRVQGHENIVHGGFLATLIDEGLVRCAFPHLPRKYGATATLELNYRQPSFIDSYLMLECNFVNVKGRKVWVEGAMYNLNEDGPGPKPLVEASALVIEPRWAKYISWMF
jgi:hypothetical protein